MAESDQLRALGCTAEFANTVDALTDGNVLSRIAALETGIGALAIKDEGSTVVTTPTALDFRGAGVTVTNPGGSTARVTIAGGGGGGSLPLTVLSAPGQTTMEPNTRYFCTVALVELLLPVSPVPDVGDVIEIVGRQLNVGNGGGGDSKLWFGAVASDVDALYGPADTTLCALKLVAFRVNNLDGIDWAVVAHEGDISDTPPA